MILCAIHTTQNNMKSLRIHLLPNYHMTSYKENKTTQFNTFFKNLKK